jgi:hypothetical protein
VGPDRLEIHMVKLPLFKAMAPDFKKSPRCWLTAIVRVRGRGKSLREVVGMDPALKEFCEDDPGFAQFVDRYGIVASTPEMLKAYNDWQIAQMAWREEIAWIKAEGIAETQLNIALVLFCAVKPGDDSRGAIMTARSFGIPEDIIQAAKEQAEAERT